MTPEQIQHFKKKLEDERQAVEAEVKELEKMPEFGSDVTEYQDEEADEAEEFGNNLSMVFSLKTRLAAINEALRKIEENRYGKCEKCGKEIEMEILEINPESELCRECKVAAEQKNA